MLEWAAKAGVSAVLEGYDPWQHPNVWFGSRNLPTKRHHSGTLAVRVLP